MALAREPSEGIFLRAFGVDMTCTRQRHHRPRPLSFPSQRLSSDEITPGIQEGAPFSTKIAKGQRRDQGGEKCGRGVRQRGGERPKTQLTTHDRPTTPTTALFSNPCQESSRFTLAKRRIRTCHPRNGETPGRGLSLKSRSQNQRRAGWRASACARGTTAKARM